MRCLGDAQKTPDSQVLTGSDGDDTLEHRQRRQFGAIRGAERSFGFAPFYLLHTPIGSPHKQLDEQD